MVGSFGLLKYVYTLVAETPRVWLALMRFCRCAKRLTGLPDVAYLSMVAWTFECWYSKPYFRRHSSRRHSELRLTMFGGFSAQISDDLEGTQIGQKRHVWSSKGS